MISLQKILYELKPPAFHLTLQAPYRTFCRTSAILFASLENLGALPLSIDILYFNSSQIFPEKIK